MKRSLVSLAALAAVSESHRHSSVTLFGRVDLTEPRPPERIRLQPPAEFWLQADLGTPSYASNVLVMGAKQIGKSAALARLGLRGREDFGASVPCRAWTDDEIRSMRDDVDAISSMHHAGGVTPS